MTSRVAGAFKLVALAIAVVMLVAASFLRSRDREDRVVDVIELSGPAASTTTTTEELPTVEVPIEVAPPSVHIDVPPSIEADDDGAIDAVPSNADDPFQDNEGAGNHDDGDDHNDGEDDGDDE